MSEYVKQVWEDGVSPVNAERLNHMEEGIAGAGGAAPFVITLGDGDPVSGLSVDKPYEEIKAQVEAGNLTNMYLVWHVDDNNTIYSRPSMLTPGPLGDTILFTTIAVDSYGQMVAVLVAVLSDPNMPNETVAVPSQYTLVNA